MIKKILKSKRGERTYIETAIFVIAVVMFISFALQLFAIISTKQQMDVAADQLVRQIQYSGEVTSDTDALFAMVCGKVSGAENLRYSVSTTYFRDSQIQLGTPFRVEVRGTVYIGRIGTLSVFPIELVSSASGISEEYWK